MDHVEFTEAISPWLGDADGPVRASLTLAIRQAIGSGQLPQGSRLPPERSLATALNVSRPTVSAVIDELRAGGLVRSRQGSGTWVSGGSARTEPSIPFIERIMAPGQIDLASATAPDAGWLPPIRLESADLLVAEPANGLNPMGLWSLREAVACRAARFVADTTAANVIITSGAHQALALMVATFAPRGSTIIVEETTYGGLVDIIAANGCHAIGAPMDDDGAIPNPLGNLIERHRPALTILVTPVHSPTGTISSAERCWELFKTLKGTDTQVVLDETYADLEFSQSGRQLSTALGHRAVRVGSLSKSLWTGLRTGWIIAPVGVCTEITLRRWQQFDLGPAVASQLVALQAFDGIDDRIARRCRRLEETAEWTRNALLAAFPEWKPAPVHGGPAMWVELPGDGDLFAAEAAAKGVAVLPGSACRADNAGTPHIRICFDRPRDLLEAAIDRLG
ncbi:PLP-dependent aminotransferase family protein [Acidimicrobiaceae bacterium AH-315-P05]|nr:PLP-dependent aminotransferase family protein [Acidimicrobiaceae bacterium AH-315-P05]